MSDRVKSWWLVLGSTAVVSTAAWVAVTWLFPSLHSTLASIFPVFFGQIEAPRPPATPVRKEGPPLPLFAVNPFDNKSSECVEILVIDIGTDFVRCCLTASKKAYTFPAMVVCTRKASDANPALPFLRSTTLHSGVSAFVGDVATEALRIQSSLRFPPTTRNGDVVDLDVVEALVRRCAYLLDTSVDAQPLLLCCSFASTREAICERLFEDAGVSSFTMIPQETLSLFSVRRMSGLSVHVGAGCTRITPVYMGCTMVDACVIFHENAHSFTDTLMSVIPWDKGGEYCAGESSRRRAVNVMKRRFLSVATKRTPAAAPTTVLQEGQEESDDSDALEHLSRVLPKDPTKPADVFFHPENGLQHAIKGSLEKLPEEARPYMLANVVLSGGCTHLPGFAARLGEELEALFPDVAVSVVRAELSCAVPEHVDVNAIAGSSALRGAEELACASFVDGLFYTAEDYDSRAASVAKGAFL